jgi:hypothetical protein
LPSNNSKKPSYANIPINVIYRTGSHVLFCAAVFHPGKFPTEEKVLQEL